MPDTEGHRAHDSLIRNVQNRHIYRHGKHTGGCQSLGEGQGRGRDCSWGQGNLLG